MRKRLSELNYYELLGVPPDATHDRIKAAFHKFAGKYHPDRATSPEARQRAERIYRRGTEAYRVLTNPPQRAAYDHGLAAGRLRYDPAEPMFHARPSMGPTGANSARARPFLQRAQQAVASGDLKAARLHLKMALSHAPGWEEAQDLLTRVEAQLSAEGD